MSSLRASHEFLFLSTVNITSIGTLAILEEKLNFISASRRRRVRENVAH